MIKFKAKRSLVSCCNISLITSGTCSPLKKSATAHSNVKPSVTPGLK